jgi:1-phosphatidylinositol-4-phosphate 5-kinase
MKSPGKSGSQLFITDDLLFILKSLTQEEYDVFRNMLFSYYRYVLAQPNTLLIKIFALYTLRSRDKDLHFMVMENIAPPKAPITVRFDLKGSTYGRTAPPAERLKQVPLLKDNDFQRRLYLGPTRRRLFLSQALSDSQWLASHGIMDYSLLLCIATIPLDTADTFPRGFNCFRQHYGGIRSSDDHDKDFTEVYYLGIIDIFQTFNLRKRFEYSLKSLVAKSGPDSLSSVDPAFYTRRFNDYLHHICGATNTAPVFVSR